MKKLILLTVVAGSIAISTQAQSILRIAPELGVTSVNMSQTIDFNKYNTTSQIGFRIGAVADISMGAGSKFYLQPGINLSFNNGTHSSNKDNYATLAGVPARTIDDRYYHITSINVPVYFVYKTGQYFDYPHFFAGVGLFLNTNIGGRFKQDYNTILNGDNRVVHYDRPAYLGSQYKRDDIGIWDFGPTATIGYEIPMGFYIKAYYGYGIVNQSPGSRAGESWHNYGGGLSIGFWIDTKPRQTWGWK